MVYLAVARPTKCFVERRLVEAAGIEPASEDLHPRPLHAYPDPVYLTPDSQEPAKTCQELSSKFRRTPEACGRLAYLNDVLPAPGRRSTGERSRFLRG